MYTLTITVLLNLTPVLAFVTGVDDCEGRLAKKIEHIVQDEVAKKPKTDEEHWSIQVNCALKQGIQAL